MSEQFITLDSQEWTGVPTPWNSRIVLPFIWSLFGVPGEGVIAAASLVGSIGALLYILLVGFFLRKFVHSSAVWLALMTIVIISPAFPLRQTLAHPLTGIWLEGLAALTLAAIWVRLRERKIDPLTGSFMIAISIFFSIAREFFFYGLIIFLFLSVGERLLRKFSDSRPSPNASPTLGRHRDFILLVAITTSAVARWLVQQALPPSIDNPLQAPMSILVSLYRWANLVDLFTAVFIALGSFMLLFLLTNKARNSFQETHYLKIPSIVLAVFAFAGGTDLDRFLVWGAPVFIAYFFSSRRFKELPSKGSMLKIGWSITAVALALSLRPMLPAVPSYALVESKECGVFPAIDFDSNRARGITFDRNPQSILVSSGDVGNATISPNTALISQHALDSCGQGLFFDSNSFGLNNVPVILGFASNQYDLLTLHPFHGDWKSKLPFVGQWAFLLALLAFFMSPGVWLKKIQTRVSKTDRASHKES
jgi:hypothetical protein